MLAFQVQTEPAEYKHLATEGTGYGGWKRSSWRILFVLA